MWKLSFENFNPLCLDVVDKGIAAILGFSTPFYKSKFYYKQVVFKFHCDRTLKVVKQTEYKNFKQAKVLLLLKIPQFVSYSHETWSK